jgi:hemoglobin-like flavoprotein
MTPAQIAAVERTLEVVDLDELAVDFYQRTFAAHPDIAEMFTSDPVAQRARFAVELRAIVGSIRDLDAFRAAAADLGRRHRGYGVRANHYRVVGEMLLAGLAAAAGDSWSVEVAESWALAYNLITEAMLAGALEVPAES